MNRRHATTLAVASTFVLLVAAVRSVEAGSPQPPKGSRSDLIRAMAEYGKAKAANLGAIGNFLSSMAQIEKTREATRTVRLTNDQKEVQVYFERKRINRKYRDEFHKRTMDNKQATRIAQSSLPGRLNVQFVSFVSANNCPTWPYVLMGDDYQAPRQQVENAWLQRRGLDNRGTRSCHEIQVASAKMRQLLKQHVRDVSPMEWIHANQFLKSLAYEAGQPGNKPGNLLAKR